MLLAKLPKLPLGTVTDTPSGKLKETIVDQVDGIAVILLGQYVELHQDPSPEPRLGQNLIFQT